MIVLTKSIEIWKTDTNFELSSADLSAEDWREWRKIQGHWQKQPLSHAVESAVFDATREVEAVAKDSGSPIPFGRSVQIVDDGRIAAAVQKVRDAVAAREARLTAAAPQYTCSGGHGCRQPVAAKGGLCRQCAHDAD